MYTYVPTPVPVPIYIPTGSGSQERPLWLLMLEMGLFLIVLLCLWVMLLKEIMSGERDALSIVLFLLATALIIITAVAMVATLL